MKTDCKWNERGKTLYHGTQGQGNRRKSRQTYGTFPPSGAYGCVCKSHAFGQVVPKKPGVSYFTMEKGSSRTSPTQAPTIDAASGGNIPHIWYLFQDKFPGNFQCRRPKNGRLHSNSEPIVLLDLVCPADAGVCTVEKEDLVEHCTSL
ncbi:unnamed protein product [Allacma fusca]|uniref:Uncharacterized protein n=1 Tax=Allacma fusca TaxID=39272 RepID=A0A8J2J6Q3_9HEXA|nr:unnamed protein product [Allacma fusca]